MTRVVLKGLLARRTRAILTSLAVVLGVAMISGTFVLTDTMKKAFDGVFDSAFQHTSVVVTGKQIVEESANRPTVPASMLGKVEGVPGVAAASGTVNDQVRLVGRDGEVIGGSNGDGIGFGVDPQDPRFSPITLTAGRYAHGPHEILIDAHTAEKEHYAIGDEIGAKGNGTVRTYTITGTGKLGGADVGSLTLAGFDVPTAQAVMGREGRFDEIDVAAAAGVTEAELAHRIQPLLTPALQVKTSDEAASDATDEVGSAIKIIRSFLLAFGGIALFVGAFVIFNTISITVAQRSRELATLRTLGASRRQVLRSVLLETLVIGLVASGIGILLGLGLAKGLSALFAAMGAELPKTGTVLSARTVIVSGLAGTIVTVLAGLFPALRATRVPPITAVREGAVVPPSRFAPIRPYVAGVASALGVAAVAYGVFAGGSVTSVLGSMAVGVLLLFVGVAMLSSHLVGPIAMLVGRPARTLGGPAGRLASQNAVRNPGRTAMTAAALMIGLALVTFVATLGSGLRDSFGSSLDKQIRSDYVVSVDQNSDVPLFSREAGDALAGADGVTVASSVRSDQARVLGATTPVVGVDPATIGRVYHLDLAAGSQSALTRLGDGAIVRDDYADEHHLRVGSPLELQTPNGDKRTFEVRGTYTVPDVEPLLDGVVISQATFDRTFPEPRNAYTFVTTDRGAGPASKAALARALHAYPDAQLDSKASYIAADQKDLDKLLSLLYVLLALSVVVSLFGMVNTMILSVFERTRELGMLRAIGMSRRQARRMVRHESVITALIGAALGLPLGVFLAAIVTRGLSDQGIGFHLPVGSLIAFTVVAAVAGTLAAVPPARRASRLDVLRALQYE
jgi:putative ABC transport system permease protein